MRIHCPRLDITRVVASIRTDLSEAVLVVPMGYTKEESTREWMIPLTNKPPGTRSSYRLERVSIRRLRLRRLKLRGQNAPKTASPRHCKKIVRLGGT